MMRRKLISHTVIIFLVLFTIHPPIARTQTIIVDTLQIPEFSMERGVYNENFDLTISSTIPNAVIKYTVDCSDPHTSSTAITHNSPVTIHVDPESAVGGRAVTPGFVIRACTIAPDQSISESVTKTYLFINKVAALSPSGIKPGSQWPNPTTSSNPQSIDYGLAQDVLNDSRYKNRIEEALLSIPTISVSTDLKNLFDRNTGIYMNAYSDGINWERPASIELLNPSVSSDENSEGFQINAGLRIRGGASRSGSNRKHAFRVFFRNEYGKAKLKYPLFGKEGVDEFDNIDLRTSQNYAWSFPNHQGECQTMNRDVYTRDLQGLMKQPYTRSRFYHLYLNGVYWGIYQTQERPEGSEFCRIIFRW